MAFAAAIPALISGGIGLYQGYQAKKQARRAKERGYGDGDYLNNPAQTTKFERYTPDQQQLFQQIQSLLTGQGEQPKGGLLGETFGDEGFNAYADPAIRAYNEKIVPNIAERFSSFGAGAQGSSAFQNRLAQSGQDLARDLGEFRGRQRQEATMGLLGKAFEPQFNTYHQPGGPSQAAEGLGALGGVSLESISKMIMDVLGPILNKKKQQYGPGNMQTQGQGSYIDRSGNITGPMY